METAFEVVLAQPESMLRHVYGDLDKHRLMYKQQCIYDGEFHNSPLAEFPEDIQLFPNVHKYTQEQWVEMLKCMYNSYADCTPRRYKHSNFIPGDPFSNAGYLDFHHRRVALDMFIIFGYHAGVFEWSNSRYFMLRVCENCIVYKRWMV